MTYNQKERVRTMSEQMTWTEQEVFDTVWAGMESQGWEQSLDEYGDCAYRGLNGLRCAVGHLIPDDLYYPGIEVYGADCEPLLEVLKTVGVADHLPLLCKLQEAHDNFSQHACREEFRHIARERGLTVQEEQ